MTLSMSTAVAEDSNCARFESKSNDPSWAQDFFFDTQNKIKSQSDALKTYSDELPDCMKETGGLAFDANGNLVIQNESKFKTFRMSGSVPACNIYSAGFASSSKLDNNYTKRNGGSTDNPTDSTALVTHYRETDYSINQARVTKKLEQTKVTLASLQDVSLKNYCAHQFYQKDLNKEVLNLKREAETCKKLTDGKYSNSATQEKSASCMNQVNDRFNKLKKAMDLVAKNKTLNNVDQALYSDFKNNADALAKALLSAKNAYLSGSKNYEIARRNNAMLDPSKLGSCSKEDALADAQFQKGLCASANDALPSKLKGVYMESANAMSDLMRKNLVSEMNRKIFSKVISALPFVANEDELRAIKSGNLEEVCSKFDLDSKSEICNGQESAKALQDGLSDYLRNGKQHFLSKSDPEVSLALRSHFKELVNICSLLDPKGSGNSENQASVTAELNIELDKLFTDPVAGPYAMTDSVRKKLKKFGKGTCEDYSDIQTLSLPTLIKDAKSEFRETALSQLKICSNNGLPNYHEKTGVMATVLVPEVALVSQARHQIGALECGVSGDRKYQMGALYQQYASYPQLFGQVVHQLKPDDQKLYAKIICSSKKCNQNVISGNQALYKGSLTLLMAAGTVFTGGAASAAILATTAAVSAAHINSELDVVNDKKNQLRAGVEVGSYTPSTNVMKTLNGLDQTRHAIYTEAVIDAVFLGVATKVKFFSGSGRSTSEVVEETTEGVIKESPQIAQIYNKIMSNIPAKFREKAKEILKDHIKEKTMHGFKEGAYENVEKDDFSGKVFAERITEKLTFGLISFDKATEHLAEKMKVQKTEDLTQDQFKDKMISELNSEYDHLHNNDSSPDL